MPSLSRHCRPLIEIAYNETKIFNVYENMRAVVQRVREASVAINGGEKRKIGRGIVVLLGVGESDARENARWLAGKIVSLRIFPNSEGKFDRSILDTRGEILAVSQFTLYGDCRKGRRPDFTGAARPEKAAPLYEEFVNCLKASGIVVRTGEFAADMLVEIQNDGPVTLLIDTDNP